MTRCDDTVQQHGAMDSEYPKSQTQNFVASYHSSSGVLFEIPQIAHE
ncbi:MAG: hypothetical protein WBA57_10220 [Elainellaceae cyanobacterium]